VGAGRHRGLQAAQVRHQDYDPQPIERGGERHEIRGVRQLRQQRSRHEGADLDLAQAGGTDAGGLPAALASVADWVRERAGA
jgi:hypothetical protein